MTVMTIRKRLERQARRVNAVACAGLAIFILGFMFGRSLAAQAAGMLALLLAILTITCASFVVVCPKCRGALKPTANFWLLPFSVPKDIRACPFCRADFDAPFHED